MATALQDLATQGIALMLTDVPAAPLLHLASAGADKGITLFNVAAPDDALRQELCREQCDLRGALTQHAGRCTGAISCVEEMVSLGVGLWLTSGGRVAGRCLSS